MTPAYEMPTHARIALLNDDDTENEAADPELAHASAIQLQCAWRQVGAVRELSRRASEVKHEAELQLAAFRIQGLLRSRKSRRMFDAVLHEHRKTKAAVKVQCMWRSRQSRRAWRAFMAAARGGGAEPQSERPPSAHQHTLINSPGGGLVLMGGK